MGNESDLLANLRHWSMRWCSAEMERKRAIRRGDCAETEESMARCLSRLETVEDDLADVEASAPDVPDDLVEEATAVVDEVMDACLVETSAGVVRNLSALGYSPSEIGYALIGRGAIRTPAQAVRNVYAHKKAMLQRDNETLQDAPASVEVAPNPNPDPSVDKTGLVGLLYDAVRQTVMRWQEANAQE